MSILQPHTCILSDTNKQIIKKIRLKVIKFIIFTKQTFEAIALISLH